MELDFKARFDFFLFFCYSFIQWDVFEVLEHAYLLLAGALYFKNKQSTLTSGGGDTAGALIDSIYHLLAYITPDKAVSICIYTKPIVHISIGECTRWPFIQ